MLISKILYLTSRLKKRQICAASVQEQPFFTSYENNTLNKTSNVLCKGWLPKTTRVMAQGTKQKT
jgi:hypothetical protein